MDIVVPVTCGVYVSLTAAVTIECDTGAAYQDGIRNLAADRWQSMYPS